MKLNKGLIYTNDKCIGCNRCISGCPVMGANLSRIEKGQNRIHVDAERCIHCGHCIEVCQHGAREYRDDTERFFADLADGVPISLIFAPAAAVNFGRELEHVLGYLKALGVRHIYNASFGADITTWAYLKYIAENHFSGGISQPCPAVVNYVEKYLPELIPYLMPVQSPLICGAIYIHKYLGDSNRLAFISPCIAKKDEIEAAGTGGHVSYNVTLSHLLDKLKDVSLADYQAAEEQPAAGLGVIYSMPGGLKVNLEQFLGYEELIRQIDGEDRVYRYLEEYGERIQEKKRLPFLVDALNCSQGCNFGTATLSKLIHDDDLLFALQEKKNRKVIPGTDDPFERGISYEERRERLNRRFAELSLNDFIRSYDRSAAVEVPEVPEDARRRIFASMHKKTHDSQIINCHSCGFDSCEKMVAAIYGGFNCKENCVYYMKDENLRMYYTDSASGIPNVNAYTRFIGEKLAKGQAGDYVAANFNIKNFKLVNQIYGSAEGDRALVEFARQVNAWAGGDELVARVGEDTFVAMLRRERMPDFIQHLTAVPLTLYNRDGLPEEYPVAARVGIYFISGDEGVPGKIMNRAANACSMTRNNKSVDVVYYDDEQDRKMIREGEIARLLRPALDALEFMVYYQPKVHLGTKQLIGAEALVRWVHDGKMIMPMEFIPIGEATGMVCAIDFYVLEMVCAHISEWLKKGLEVVRISVNFSKLHFAEPGVGEKILKVIEKWAVPREYLEVECTETAYMEEYENLSAAIACLKAQGVTTSIDDFGTGYSSLNLLQELRCDVLKIDRSFLNSRAEDGRNRAVISHIVGMANDLEMKVVSEGVESEADLNFLSELSGDQSNDIIVQGFLFDRPMPVEEFETRMQRKFY